MLLAPLASAMLESLHRDYALDLPSEPRLLMGAVREVCEDVLPVARRVDAWRNDGTFTFTLHQYLLFPGCVTRREASPECCSLCPCSICSLIACMMAEGLRCGISLNRVDLDTSDRSLRVELFCIPENEIPVPA
jgi:hypothetical protein